MSFFESAQFGLLAEGLFDLLGPALIFGIYIIGALAKNWVKRDQGTSEEENQSELKKAVRKRYEKIHQRQLGEDSPQLKRTQKSIPIARTVRQEENRPKQISQWEQQQQAIRQRNAKLQEQRITPKTTRQSSASITSHVPKKKMSKEAVPRKIDQVQKDRPMKNILRHMMNRPENLRSAIILKEILDKPLALRGLY